MKVVPLAVQGIALAALPVDRAVAFNMQRHAGGLQVPRRMPRWPHGGSHHMAPYHMHPKIAADRDGQVRDLLTEMLPHLAGGVAILNADGSVVSWDSEAERMTAYTLQEVQNFGFVQLFAPAEVMQHIIHKAQQGIPTLHEYLELKRRDHTRIGVTVQSSPQSSMSRSAGQIVVAFRELAPLQENLRRHEQMEMLGRLASALSHEIRNPLNALMLQVDLLQEVLQQLLLEPHPQVTESLMEIQTELSRTHELVQDYLSLTRLTNLHREPVDLQALLEELSHVMQEPLATRQIAFRLEGVDSLGHVSCHKGTLRRALLNLMQNAIEAMVHGGTLTLRGWQEPGWVSLAICDTGSGVPEEELPQLFMPFQTTKPDGTGLGLFVVQEIIAAHAGTIEVSSTPGQGTTFTVKLPCPTAQEAT